MIQPKYCQHEQTKKLVQISKIKHTCVHWKINESIISATTYFEENPTYFVRRQFVINIMAQNSERVRWTNHT